MPMIKIRTAYHIFREQLTNRLLACSKQNGDIKMNWKGILNSRNYPRPVSYCRLVVFFFDKQLIINLITLASGCLSTCPLP